MDGRSCACGVSSLATLPVLVSCLRNDLGMMGPSVGAPRVLRHWRWSDRAGMAIHGRDLGWNGVEEGSL
jgi:hypothetical protein